MARLILTVLLALCVVVPIVMTRHSLRLHRTPNQHNAQNAPFMDKYWDARNGRVAGNTIKMGGGLLTLGTYITTLTVGTPPLSFSVLVDTGSANTALPGAGCSNCGKGFQPYDPSSSSTAQGVSCSSAACQVCSPPGLFNNTSKCAFHSPQCASSGLCGYGITYGGGSSAHSGDIYTDNVCLGKYCLSNYNVGRIQTEYPAESFSNAVIQGIMGLCYEFNACNPTCTTPIFDSIVNTYAISNEFAVCLTPSSGGYLDLGFTNSSRMTTPFDYTPVITEHWYNISPLDVKVGGISIGVPTMFFVTTNDVIGTFVDSGTSVLLLGPLAYDSLVLTFKVNYGNLTGITGKDNFWDGNCIKQSEVDLSKYPNVNITLPRQGQSSESFDVSVPASSYLLPEGDRFCMGIGSASSIGMVMGDVFMENYYVHFDRANRRLGFSPLASGSCS